LPRLASRHVLTYTAPPSRREVCSHGPGHFGTDGAGACHSAAGGTTHSAPLRAGRRFVYPEACRRVPPGPQCPRTHLRSVCLPRAYVVPTLLGLRRLAFHSAFAALSLRRWAGLHPVFRGSRSTVGQGAPYGVGIRCGRHSPATGPLPNRYSRQGQAATDPPPNRYRIATFRVLVRSLRRVVAKSHSASNQLDKSAFTLIRQRPGSAPKCREHPSIPLLGRYPFHRYLGLPAHSTPFGWRCPACKKARNLLALSALSAPRRRLSQEPAAAFLVLVWPPHFHVAKSQQFPALLGPRPSSAQCHISGEKEPLKAWTSWPKRVSNRPSTITRRSGHDQLNSSTRSTR